MLHADRWINMSGQLQSPNVLLLGKERGVAHKLVWRLW